jgi:hypothetical protein
VVSMYAMRELVLKDIDDKNAMTLENYSTVMQSL